MWAYVGSRTTRERNARGEGLSVYAVDAQCGRLERVQLVSGLVNPSYLCLSADRRMLYTVHGDMSEVSAFGVDAASGQLSFVNTRSTGGRNPVHLALDRSGQHLVVSNHLASTVVVLPLLADGSIGEVCHSVTLSGPLGPHRIEQQLAKPHFNPFDPSGRFVLVPDKGLDRVFSFRFQAGRLEPASTPFATAREGAGPRGLVFHPSRPLAYVVNELDSSVTTYGFDAATGALNPLQILPSLPSDFTGNSRAAGIAVDAAGRRLYVSNRGYDSIAVFEIDAASGLLQWLQAVPTGGRTPRFFTLSPNGRLLFALNEDSDNISVFDVDAQSGQLQANGEQTACGSPVCMVFNTAAAAP